MIKCEIQIQYIFYREQFNRTCVIISLSAGKLVFGNYGVMSIGDNPSSWIASGFIINSKMLKVNMIHSGFFP
ncbi:hypothetical protein D3C76_1563140 [compost metagenome]